MEGSHTVEGKGAGPGRDDRKRWLALLLVCAAQLMIVLDGTIVNVALPVIQNSLGFSEVSLSWVVNAYLLTPSVASYSSVAGPGISSVGDGYSWLG